MSPFRNPRSPRTVLLSPRIFRFNSGFGAGATLSGPLRLPTLLLLCLLLASPRMPHAQDVASDLMLDDLSRTSDSLGMHNLYKTARSVPDLKIFVELAEVAGLQKTLQMQGPLTVFAPTDAAFRALPVHELDSLRHDPKRCRQFLLQHMVRRQYPSMIVVKEMKLVSLVGTGIELTKDHAGLKVRGRRPIKVDLHGTNGVLYVVDQILGPVPPNHQK